MYVDDYMLQVEVDDSVHNMLDQSVEFDDQASEHSGHDPQDNDQQQQQDDGK